MTDTFEELAATVAHEIKNPLSMALANVYLMKKEDKERNFAKYSGAIEIELQKINELLIDFLQATKAEIKNESIELYAFLLPLVERYQNAPGKPETVSVILKRPASPMVVEGDAKRLGIVVNNLIKNAIEAVGDAGCVLISLKESETEIKLYIRDDGCGFPLALVEGQSTKDDGNGLGLGICKRIVSEHGGGLVACNNPDKGATVVVSLKKYTTP